MKTSIYIICKYWKKHKKNAAALLFAGVLLTTVILVMLMTERENFNREVQNFYDRVGCYDVMLGNSNDELLAKVTEGKIGYNYGVMYALGKMGYLNNRYTYGIIEDEHNIWRIPLDEGRMPETENELAAPSTVLDSFYWVGKCGDTITLEGKTYTVVGITNETYTKYRAGSQLLSEELDILQSYINCGSDNYIPLIFVGKNDEKPLYRIDILNNFFGTNKRYLDGVAETVEVHLMLSEAEDPDTQWFSLFNHNDLETFYLSNFEKNFKPVNFFMIIARIGAAVSVLSVFSVLRTVFIERQSRIDMLKRIGMKKRAIGGMYVIECAVFSVIQAALGFIVGFAAYWGVFLFKTRVLGKSAYSCFTSETRIIKSTRDPFLYAVLFSVAITVAAYLINVLTVNIKHKAVKKKRKPRSLSGCFGKVFRQSGVTVVQTASLVLICFAVMMGYMFYTDNGKTGVELISYLKLPENIVNGFDMERNNIEEYYSCSPSNITELGDMNKSSDQRFPFLLSDITCGFDDETASKLPEYALAAGYLEQTVFVSDEPNNKYINEIDLSDNDVRNAFLVLSDEKFHDFFSEGQIGSKYMYRVRTKLTPDKNITALGEQVTDGAIDLEAVNSGKEILLTYNSPKPPFKAGETVTICSTLAGQSGYGAGDIAAAEVKIGAIIHIPDSLNEVREYVVRDDFEYNFLTTASGAQALGFHSARYTEVYSFDTMDGSIFPSSAEMRVNILSKMKMENFVKKAAQYGGTLLILLIMSLLGFAAYFNGIGMKIRLKAYEISAMRAIGAPVSKIRAKLLLSGLKIPLTASVLSYGMTKAAQAIMEEAYQRYYTLYKTVYPNNNITVIIGKEPNELLAKAADINQNFFLESVMWQVSAEIPSLILFVILCAVTFILTAIALKKFKGDIAGDLNKGRTRQ